jgi:hypothetical protein
MEAAIGCESFDRGHGMAVGAIRRNQATVHRIAVEEHGAGAAVAGVAAFLDAEVPEIAQKRSQALPRSGKLGKILAVDVIAYGSTRSTDAGRRFRSAPEHAGQADIRVYPLKKQARGPVSFRRIPFCQTVVASTFLERKFRASR